MIQHSLRFRLHDGLFAVCRLPAGDPWPSWLPIEAWCNVTRTPEEFSIVCPEEFVPAEIQAGRGWKRIELAGPFEFTLTGVIAAILIPLAEARIPVFAISTYNTDWILAPDDRIEEAVRALQSAGHNET